MITFIENGYSSKMSGGDKHAHEMLNHLASQGKKVEVILPEGVFDDEYVDTVCMNRYTRVPQESRAYDSSLLLFLLYLYRILASSFLLARSRATKVVASSHLFHDVLPLLVVGGRKKVYAYVHHILSEQDRSGLHRYITTALERTSFIVLKRVKATLITVSPVVTRQLIEEYGFESRQIRESSNPVDVGLYRSDRSFSQRDIDVLFCGRIHAKKGIHEFLGVVRQLKTTLPLVRAVIIGSGPEAEMIQKEIEIDPRISDIDFLGFVDEETKRDLLSRTRLLISPTHEEGWGIAVAESLASGVPVVISKLPDIQSIWQDAVIWIEKQEVHRFASVANELLSAPEQWRVRSERGRSWVRRYDRDGILSKEMSYFIE